MSEERDADGEAMPGDSSTALEFAHDDEGDSEGSDASSGSGDDADEIAELADLFIKVRGPGVQHRRALYLPPRRA